MSPRLRRWIDTWNPLAGASAEEARVGRLAVVLAAIVSGAAVVYGGVYLALGAQLPAVVALTCAPVALLTVPVLAHTLSRWWAAHFLAATTFMTLVGVIAGTGGLHSGAGSWPLLAAMIASMVGGRRAGIPWVGASVVHLAVLYALDGTGWLPRNHLPDWFDPVFLGVAPAGLMLCAFLVAWSFDVAQEVAIGQVQSARRAAEAAHEAARAVLDNVDEGLFVVDALGTMQPERSAAFDAWFPPLEAGVTAWDYFRGLDEGFALMLQFGLEQLPDDLLPRDLLLEQLPSQLEYAGRTFRLRYRSLGEGPKASVLVVVVDVTPELEAEAAKREQREMLELFLRANDDRQVVGEFFDDARQMARSLAVPGQGFDVEKRILHTLKGNCGMFGLAGFAAWIHRLEDRLQEVGVDVFPPEERAAFTAEWNALEARISPFVASGDDHPLSVDRVRYEEVLALAETETPPDQIARALRTWTWDSLLQRMEHLAEQSRALALRLGKPDTVVNVDCPQLYLPPSSDWRAFWGAAVHAIRNALDHGIETAAERRSAGKPSHGTLTLRAQATATQVDVIFEDDGRGVDWAGVAEKATSAGLDARSHPDLVEALFSDGFTTRSEASETSGRGVGTSALRAAARRLGGGVDVESAPGRGARFRFSIPLPPEVKPWSRGASSISV